MHFLLGNGFWRGRYALAIVAGLSWAAAFPLVGIAGLAWIAPGLLAAAGLGKRFGESFRIGFVGGLAFYLGSLYWLLLIPYRWHGLPLGPALGWIALSGYLALYPALWVSLLSLALGSGKASSVADRELPGGIRIGSWGQRMLWALFGAALWVALEMVIARLMSGFPWNLMGASQYNLTPLIQVASVTGIYGLSFLVVWLSLALLSAVLMLIQHPGRRSWTGEILLPMLVVSILFAWGARHMRRDAPSGRSLKVALIQPSIPQTLIWDASKDEERFAELLRLSERALNDETDLLVWPEAAVPRLLRYDEPTYEAVTGLAKKHGVWMIIGADDAERRTNPPPGGKKVDYYNSSFLITPEGVLKENYQKRSLVIFGEYVPLERWLPFLKFFTPVEGGFTPGQRPKPFELDALARASVLICFEDVFPKLAREATEEETDFLVNLTNNGWFGEGAAQWQHAISGVFRAVENNRPLVRCCNNGLTCHVDRFGRIREVFRDRSGSIYGVGFLRFELPLSGPGERSPTFYNRHGDIFGWSCAVYALLNVLRLAALHYRRQR